MPRPHRKSLEERAIFGRADRAIAVQPNAIKVDSIPVPQQIEENPEKLRLWVFLVEDLAKRKLLSNSYIQIVEMLVNNVYLYNEYLPMLEDAGPLAPKYGKDGETVIGYEKNPIFDMVKRIETTMLKLMEKLGLTPRDAIYLSNPDAQAPIDAVIEQERSKISYFR
jgi:phage terminase small subunit